MIVLVAVGHVLFFGVVPLAVSILPFLADRFAYYTEYFSPLGGLGLWGVLFYIVFVSISIHVSCPRASPSDFSSKDVVLRSMIVVLCAFSISTEFFPIVRDRASYEMWILYSILLAKNGLKFRWEARLVAFSFGVVFTFLNVLSHPGRMVFVPYENIVVCSLWRCEGDGIERQNQMVEELGAALRR